MENLSWKTRSPATNALTPITSYLFLVTLKDRTNLLTELDALRFLIGFVGARRRIRVQRRRSNQRDALTS